MSAAEHNAPLSSAVRAEAAAWLARLHGSDRTPELEAGFRRWLEADVANSRAFELATEAWEIAGSVRRGALPRMAHPFASSSSPARRKSSRRRVLLAVAAIVGTVLAAAVLDRALNDRRGTYATDLGEQRMLTLSDGTRIFLNTDTRLSVHDEAQRRAVLLEHGEAMFDVAKDPHRPFTVTAGDREVVALGTSFVVRRELDHVTVTLVDGKVRVTSGAAHDARDLSPGQRLTFGAAKRPTLDEPALEDVTAWRRGEVVLDKTRLRDAAEEMNRYSAVKIVVVDGPTADIPLSGIFRAGDSVRFAQAVAETYHLSITHEQQRIVIAGTQR
jgi:transmembrane sensor